jgi:hypothetical protein
MQNRICHKAHNHSSKNVPPVKRLGYGNLVETPDKKDKNQDSQLGISYALVYSIIKEGCSWNRNDITDGIG